MALSGESGVSHDGLDGTLACTDTLRPSISGSTPRSLRVVGPMVKRYGNFATSTELNVFVWIIPLRLNSGSLSLLDL